MCSMKMFINVLEFRESGFLSFLGLLTRMPLFGSLLCSEGLLSSLHPRARIIGFTTLLGLGSAGACTEGFACAR